MNAVLPEIEPPNHKLCIQKPCCDIGFGQRKLFILMAWARWWLWKVEFGSRKPSLQATPLFFVKSSLVLWFCCFFVAGDFRFQDQEALTTPKSTMIYLKTCGSIQNSDFQTHDFH